MSFSLSHCLLVCYIPGGDPDLQNVPTAGLSGGQRSRVALAAVSFVKPHVRIAAAELTILLSLLYCLQLR